MGGELFVPVHDEDAMRGFLLQAIRAQTLAVDAMREQGTKRDEKLDKIVESLHSIDKRLVIIEASTLARDVERLREDLKALEAKYDAKFIELEAERNQRKGAMTLVEFVAKYWPALLAIAALVAFLIERGGTG